MFNCTRDDVLRLLSSSPNSAADPDGYSYATLKQLGAAIIEPLVIIFQQSLQKVENFQHCRKKRKFYHCIKKRVTQCVLVLTDL